MGHFSVETLSRGLQILEAFSEESPSIISANLHVGSRLPVHCTCMGKAQLIDLSRQELDDLLGEGPYRKMGPHTITTLDALVAELDNVRKLGYAINDEELAAGLRAVAAPVRDRSGEIVAAVNIFVGGRSLPLGRDHLPGPVTDRQTAQGRRPGHRPGAGGAAGVCQPHGGGEPAPGGLSAAG